MKTALYLASTLLLFSCGTDALGNSDGGGDMSANSDMTMNGVRDMTGIVGDLAYTLRQDGGPVICGGAGACSGGDKCCINTAIDGGMTGAQSCQPACGGQSITVECRGPSQCGGNPCCVMASLGGGVSVSDITCAASTAECVPNVGGAGLTTRLCEFDGDCTVGVSTSLKQCCTLTAMGITQHVCLSSTLLSIINNFATATCP